jgi:hypothetical protein
LEDETYRLRRRDRIADNGVMIRALVVASVLSVSSLAAAAPNGAACAAPGDCDSGFCVDKVCCSSACNGQCEACDVVGSAGTCTAVVGAPRGDRSACDTKPATDCGKLTCDGADRSACRAFANGTTVACGEYVCIDATYQALGRCNGKGGCDVPGPASCAPYACGSTGCKTTCTTNADCVSGFTCVGGSFVGGGACSADGLSVISPDGKTTSCAPYRCFDGKCFASCAPGRDSDCKEGFVCGSDRSCVDPATVQNEEDDSGCAYSPRASHGAFALLALVALARFRARAAT